MKPNVAAATISIAAGREMAIPGALHRRAGPGDGWL
jgi:hypothetical protein